MSAQAHQGNVLVIRVQVDDGVDPALTDDPVADDPVPQLLDAEWEPTE